MLNFGSFASHSIPSNDYMTQTPYENVSWSLSVSDQQCYQVQLQRNIPFIIYTKARIVYKAG